MSGFGLAPTLFEVSIKWKHGFEHSYEQLLTPKQLESEQLRYEKYRWIDSVQFTEIK